MPAHSNHTDDRLPTNGPEIETYDQYQSVVTNNGELMIYDVEVGEAWVQSTGGVTLEEWR